MAKRKKRLRDREPAAASDATADPAPAPERQVFSSAPSLHDLFEQQARQMLDRTDLDEQQKQSILLAMSCPCCGGSAMSYTVKLKR